MASRPPGALFHHDRGSREYAARLIVRSDKPGEMTGIGPGNSLVRREGRQFPLSGSRWSVAAAPSEGDTRQGSRNRNQIEKPVEGPESGMPGGLPVVTLTERLPGGFAVSACLHESCAGEETCERLAIVAGDPRHVGRDLRELGSRPFQVVEKRLRP